MKYIISVAILTFTIAVQSSVIPISPISWAGPHLLTSSPGLVLAHSPTIAIAAAPVPEKSIAIHASTAPATAILSSPHILQIAGPQPHTIPLAAAPAPAIISTPAVIAAPAVVAAEGQYIAKTRGAIHSAPLPGHINSASSINLEAAPGTI